jgi:hypothetical protein
MAIGLGDEQWRTLDEGILRREILTTLKAIRAAAGVSLKVIPSENSDLVSSRKTAPRKRASHVR